MNYQSLKIPGIYTVLSSIYYLIAYFNSLAPQNNSDGLSEQFVHQLEQVFYWANINVIYIFSMIGSSLIGFIWYYKKSMINHYKGFAIVFILSVVSFLILMILTTFQ